MSVLDQIKSAEKLWAQSPADAINALNKIQRFNPKDEVNWQRSYVVHNEWFHRVQQGLPPYHCRSINELGFKHSRLTPYLLAAESAGSQMDMACARFHLNQPSEELFRLFEKKNHVAGTVRFNPDFHALLQGERSFDGLPPVDFHRESSKQGPSVYLACNDRYLIFAVPMIRSLQSVAPEVRCHLHVFLPEDGVRMDDVLDILPGIGISSERCEGEGPGYFHAVRFIRLLDYLQKSGSPVWLSDVDGLFNLHPQTLFNQLNGFDVALRARPGRLEPWNQLNACVVGFNTTHKSLEYLGNIAKYIHRFRGNLAWGIDQTAMFCVFQQVNPIITCLDENAIDYSYTPDGIIWANSSNLKHAHVAALTDPSVKVERPVYFERFKHFAV